MDPLRHTQTAKHWPKQFPLISITFKPENRVNLIAFVFAFVFRVLNFKSQHCLDPSMYKHIQK